tara:strand:- start:702 stop:881 length:180 start_codon:yes stop_codon:yes gene_type:complete
MKKVTEIILGIILVFIGLIGGIIPILPGWVIGLPGLILLSKHCPPIKNFIDKIKNRYMF